MKFTRILVLAIALVAGVSAAVLMLNLTPREAPRVEVDQINPATAEVLVARSDIAIGTSISRSMLQWREWPETGLSERFYVRQRDPEAPAKVIDAIARASFFAGEPIIPGKLIRSDSGFLSAILPAGKRAVATSIAADTSAGGFILPNDRVDVIMTRQEENTDGSGTPNYVTETVLNNVRVLAIDQTIEDQNGEQVVVGQTATLELSLEQAQILTVAQQLAERLTLALRSIADAGEDVAAGDAIHLIGKAKREGSVTIVRGGVTREVGGIR